MNKGRSVKAHALHLLCSQKNSTTLFQTRNIPSQAFLSPARGQDGKHGQSRAPFVLRLHITLYCISRDDGVQFVVLLHIAPKRYQLDIRP